MGAKGKVVELKRQIGLLHATTFIINTMIGSGIFVTPGYILYYSGSVNLSLIIWAVCGVLCLLSSLAYAELATLVPKSGSEYAYFMETYTPMHPFWGPLPAFLYAFLDVILITPVGTAVVLLTSAEYMMEFVKYFICTDQLNIVWATKLFALLQLVLITYVNCTSVKLGMAVQNLCTVLKLAMCLMIAITGVYQLSKGNYENLLLGFEGSTKSPLNIALALYSGFWSYTGSSMITLITQEVKKPEINILKSALISVPLVTAFYLLINVSYLTLLSPAELLSSDAVAMTFGKKILGVYALVISAGVAISSFGSTLSAQFAISRLCFVASQSGHLMDCLSYIHIKNMTPVLAVAVQSIVAFIVVIVGDIINLVEFSSFIYAWVTALAMVSLMILKKRMKHIDTPLKVPLVIPVIVALEHVFLFVMPLVSTPDIKYAMGLICILIGVIIYYGIIYRRTQIPFMGPLTYTLQKIFGIVPQESAK